MDIKGKVDVQLSETLFCKLLNQSPVVRWIKG